jgi:hypothetical protein
VEMGLRVRWHSGSRVGWRVLLGIEKNMLLIVFDTHLENFAN